MLEDNARRCTQISTDEASIDLQRGEEGKKLDF